MVQNKRKFKPTSIAKRKFTRIFILLLLAITPQISLAGSWSDFFKSLFSFESPSAPKPSAPSSQVSSSQSDSCELKLISSEWLQAAGITENKQESGGPAEELIHDQLVDFLKTQDVPFFLLKQRGRKSQQIPVILANKATYPKIQALLKNVSGFGASFHPDNPTDHGWALSNGFLVDMFDAGKEKRIKQGELHQTGIVWKDLDQFMDSRHPKYSRINIVLKAYALPESVKEDFDHYHRVRRAAIYRVRDSYSGHSKEYPWNNFDRKIEDGAEHCFTFVTAANNTEHEIFMKSQIAEILEEHSSNAKTNVSTFLESASVQSYLNAFESLLKAANWKDAQAFNFETLYYSDQLKDKLLGVAEEFGINTIAPKVFEELMAFSVGLDSLQRYVRALAVEMEFKSRGSLSHIASSFNARQQFFVVIDEREGTEESFRNGSYQIQGRMLQFPQSHHTALTSDLKPFRRELYEDEPLETAADQEDSSSESEREPQAPKNETAQKPLSSSRSRLSPLGDEYDMDPEQRLALLREEEADRPVSARTPPSQTSQEEDSNEEEGLSSLFSSLWETPLPEGVSKELFETKLSGNETQEELFELFRQFPRYKNDRVKKIEDIEYRTFGNPKNPPLVLVHGLGGSYHSWLDIAELLQEDFYVIIYNQRGHGSRPGWDPQKRKLTNFSSEMMAKDLDVLVSALKLKQLNLVGHSMGGRTVVKYAALYPEKVESVIVEDMHMKGLRSYREKAFSTLKDGDRGATISHYSSQGLLEDLTEAMRSVSCPLYFFQANKKRGAVLFGKGVDHIKEHKPEAEIIEFDTGHGIHSSASEEYVETIMELLW